MRYSISQGMNHSRVNSYPLGDYGWSSDSDVEDSPSSRQDCLLSVILFFVQLMLFGSVLLFVYWVFKFDTGLDWQGDRRKMLNMHSFLMLCGFVLLNGQAMLFFKMFPAYENCTRKTMHTILLMGALSTITFGLMIGIKAQDMPHKGTDGVHFYSIHSWLGMITCGLFAFQFISGFTTFWVMLCCKKRTNKCRMQLLSTHKTMGLTILTLSLASCLTGLSQTARARLSGPTTQQPSKPDYKHQTIGNNPFLDAGLVINMVGVCLVGVGICIPFIITNFPNTVIQNKFKIQNINL